MSTPLPPGFSFGTGEPRDAMDAFARRGLLQPSFRWQDVWQDEHARAFAVAGVSRLDVLAAVRGALDDAVRTGGNLADFAKTVRPVLARAGLWGDVEIVDPVTGERRMTRFDDQRLRLIFDTNMRQSYAAGRWARIERTRRTKPFLLYRTMQDERVRASHRRWNWICLPIDHPYWKTHFPPNGWRCRCHVYAVSQRDIERLQADGHVISFEAPPDDLITYVNPSTGEIAPVPRGIDPGFAYNPGLARDDAFFDAMMRKAAVSSPLAAATAVAEATIANPAVLAQSDARFAAWVDAVLAQKQPQGAVRYIGVLSHAVVRGLRDRGIEPLATALAVRDADVLHALRDSKAAQGRAIPAEVYRQLPAALRSPAAVLRETDTGALLYVIDIVDAAGRVGKAVVSLDYAVRLMTEGKRATVRINVVRTATMINANALADRGKYDLLAGVLDLGGAAE